MPARSWLSWSRRRRPAHLVWGGVRRLWRLARASLPFKKRWVWLRGHAKKIFGTINHLLACSFDLADTIPPVLLLPSFKAPLSPRRGFTFGADRGAWLAEPNSLKSDFKITFSDLRQVRD